MELYWLLDHVWNGHRHVFVVKGMGIIKKRGYESLVCYNLNTYVSNPTERFGF